jgi:hypothetical protein
MGAVMAVGAGRTCFFCEEVIKREPAWTWFGPSGQIWLHLGCAGDFAARIFYDVVRWQQRTGRRFHEVDK